MKKILFALVISAALVPAALAAPPAQAPSAFCKANAATLVGAGKTYRNAGACVAKQQAQQEANTTSAAAACKAEQADGNFAASHATKTFAQFYGVNAKNGSNGNGNAYGKCVSLKASAKSAAQQAAQASAGKKCATAELKAQIGAGKTYANRGACVAKLSKPAS